MRRSAEETRGRRAFALTATAFLWCVGLLLAALVVPVYGGTQTTGGPGGASVTTNPSATLVGENGLGILLVVAVPALVTALVWIALHDQCSRGRRSSGYLAQGLIGLLAAFCLLAALSIGLFLLPVALLLGCAATLTPTGAPPGSA
jgi:hypothetical protein